MLKTPLSILVLISFFLSSVIGPLPQAGADEFHLPVPGVMIHLSPPLDPPMLKGIKIHPDNPFRFDFILDKGDSALNPFSLKGEATKLIKYFLASLTIPEKDLWVNLSPYEKNRIVPQSFGRTEMGRDLLAEDYMLKQITASLIYPEGEVGKKFWKRIYEQAAKKFGTTNIPVNTFNKVWIVPEKAVVYENAKAGSAYVVESKLKVMLEQDYLSFEKHHVKAITSMDTETQDTSALGSQVVREIVIPELTREVNEDKNFTPLRQVYNSLILATWYKKKIKDSILAQVYEDKNRVKGVQYSDTVIPAKSLKAKSPRGNSVNDVELIYQRYLQAFKKGVYNYIKEDIDPVTQETIPRKYFSGGAFLSFGNTDLAMNTFQIVQDQNEVPQGTQDNAVVVEEETVSAAVLPLPLRLNQDRNLRRNVVTDLSAEDGYPNNPKGYDNKKLLTRVHDFLNKYHAEHHLIDGSDTQFQDLYTTTREIFDSLIKTAGLNPSSYRLYFSDESNPNAFYLRGSNVFVVNLGLLKLGSQGGKMALSKDAVSFILAHEIVHLLQYRDDVLNGKVNQDMDLVPNWQARTEERKQEYLDEYDADWKALDLMSKAGFTVTEAPRVFRMLLDMIKRAGPHGKYIYLPFGDHPQLEPRTDELERLALGRYWPNQSETPTLFPVKINIPTSRFRDFQNRVFNMKSDEEFASLIMEAADIRELTIVISIGKERRNSPDYQHHISDPRNSLLYSLMNMLLQLKELGDRVRKYTTEDEYQGIQTQIQDLLKELPAIPDKIITELSNGVDTQEFTFTDIKSISAEENKGKTFNNGTAGAGNMILLKNGDIVIITTGERGSDGSFDVLRLMDKQAYRIKATILFGGKVINIIKERGTLTSPHIPMQAITRRIAQLTAQMPKKKLQLQFYEEMFKKHLDHSDFFSPRKIEVSKEKDIFNFGKMNEVIKAIADPHEFDVFVQGASTEELMDTLENLVPTWISLDGYQSSGSYFYRDFRETLEGNSYGNPSYPRGDYLELANAIIRTVEQRISQGIDSVNIIPRVVSVLGLFQFGHTKEALGSIRSARLRLFSSYANTFLTGQRIFDRDSARGFTELLDSLDFLGDSEGSSTDESKIQDQIAQLLYGLYKDTTTKDLVSSLFKKHAERHSPIKNKFYALIGDDQTMSLDDKLFAIEDLGRDTAGFSSFSSMLMKAPEGQGEGFVNAIVAEIITKKSSLSALENGSSALKRLAVLTYLGAFARRGELIFQVYDAAKGTLLLDADELHIFRDFISADLPWKRNFYNDLRGLVNMDYKKQLILFLSLLEFLKRKGQDGQIRRFLMNLDPHKTLDKNYLQYMYGPKGSISLTPEGLQYQKDMRTFSMFLGELMNRGVDNDMDDFKSRILGIRSLVTSEEGYSVKAMKERLEATRPQRFGRWDLMEDGDKDHLGYFSFLEEAYAGKSFEEALADIKTSFPESRLRDVMIYVLFVQKVLRDKLGIKVSSAWLFDFSWLREQVRGKGIAIHQELTAAIALLGWDRDIQKLNGKFLAEVNNNKLPVDATTYDNEKQDYTDVRFYDMGGVDSQLALALASLDEGYLIDYLAAGHSLRDQLAAVLKFYKQPSSYRDKYIKQILDQTLSVFKDGDIELTPDLEGEILGSLKVFQNVSMRERYALRFLELSLSRIQSQKGGVTSQDELEAIMKYFPNYSYTRDEVLNQFVNRHIKTTKQYRAVAHLFVQNPDNIRNAESSDHMFWKDQIRDVFMNFSASTKMEFLLWLMGLREKPEEIVREEYRLHISFDGFREAMGLHSGKFYTDIGKRDQRDFFDSLFMGEKGVFSNQSAYDDLVSYIISNLLRVKSPAVTKIFKAALNTKDIQRRQRILYSLLQKYHQLRSQGSPDQILAKSVRVFLEANGLIGIKLGQFLAHSSIVKSGSYLQKELLELNNASESMDKGIQFDMLEKIYHGRAFEDVYESLDEVMGVGGVAQVNAAKRKDGRKVALKFKKPYVDKVIDRELEYLQDELINPCAADLEAEGITVPAGLLSRFKESFEEELNFGDMQEEGTGEVNNQRLLKKNIEHRKTSVVDGVTYEFVVPTSLSVHENSLMEQEFAEGISLKKEDELRAQGIDVEAIKELLFKELIQEFLVDGFYHSDLHSGNVLVRKENGKVYISIIDLGAASRISSNNRELLVGILMALGDKNNWESNKEMIYRLFPQIQNTTEGEEELKSIVQSDNNPMKKLIQLFVLLEKKNIQFQDEYKQFYSVFRFLKASEYLFTDDLLAKVMGKLGTTNMDEIKSRSGAISQEIKREFSAIQAPVVTTTPGDGLRVIVTSQSIRQVNEALENVRTFPFWSTISGTFPQIEQLVDLVIGIAGHLADRQQDLELNIPQDKMAVYEDIKSDVQVLIAIIQRGSFNPLALMGAWAAVKRIAAKKDVIIDLILQQNIPIDEIMDTVKQKMGLAAAKRLSDIVAAHVKRVDSAMLEKGGIDFTANKIPLEIQNAGEGIKFYLDPAMLRQLQNSPGFVPVIIAIKPMKDIKGFLGVPSVQ